MTTSNKKESYQIFNQIAGTYDLLNRILSFGIDIYWRNQLLKRVPKGENLQAIDLATGTADLALTLSKHPNIEKITGVDMSEEMLSLGRVKVSQKNLEQKIELISGNGETIPTGDSTVDLVSISFGIRNFYQYEKSLVDCLRVLKPNGRLLILEFSLPKFFIVRWVYLFYFRYLLPFVGNLLSRHKDAYTYLNQTVEDFPYGEEFVDKLKTAGFKNTGYRELTFGIATLYWGDRID